MGDAITILVALFFGELRLLGNFEHRFRDLCTAGALSGPNEELTILLPKRGIEHLIIVLKCSCTLRAERGIGNFINNTRNWKFNSCTQMLVHFQGWTRNWQSDCLTRINKYLNIALPLSALITRILSIDGGIILHENLRRIGVWLCSAQLVNFLFGVKIPSEMFQSVMMKVLVIQKAETFRIYFYRK